jgi:DNA-directed RNA polymerase specialized sigma24 family protein
MNHIAANAPTPANDDDYVDRTISTAQRRERYRAALRRLYLIRDVAGPHPDQQLDARAALRSARARVTKAEWILLCAVAVGYSYTEIAARRGSTAGALRVRVSRLRRDIA